MFSKFKSKLQMRPETGKKLRTASLNSKFTGSYKKSVPPTLHHGKKTLWPGGDLKREGFMIVFKLLP